MDAINLINKINDKELTRTGYKPKLPIKLTEINDDMLYAYKIPLNLLYYNDENGRIASAISRLNRRLEPEYDFINEEYNLTIEKMIEEDNKEALSNTKKSVKKKVNK